MTQVGMEAEEIVLSVWKKRKEMFDAGKKPTRLIMSAENYRKLQEYKTRLGVLINPEMDYLQEESLFGIPVFIDNTCPLRIE
jgi:hypothetical protein